MTAGKLIKLLLMLFLIKGLQIQGLHKTPCSMLAVINGLSKSMIYTTPHHTQLLIAIHQFPLYFFHLHNIPGFTLRWRYIQQF